MTYFSCLREPIVVCGTGFVRRTIRDARGAQLVVGDQISTTLGTEFVVKRSSYEISIAVATWSFLIFINYQSIGKL